MSEIVVNLNELYALVRQMRRSDINYAVLTINPPDEPDEDDPDDEGFPASLGLIGIRDSDLGVGIDYDSIDAVGVKLPLVVMSSNME